MHNIWFTETVVYSKLKGKVKKIISERKHPEFFPGDIVKVGVRITEGKRDRIQYFEGVCIAKKSRGFLTLSDFHRSLLSIK